MRFSFYVEGDPVAKGRARVTRNGSYTPKRTREYETRVKHSAGAARSEWQATVQKCWPRDRRYRLTVLVTVSNRRRCDIDNYAKAISDALNGVAYDDDSQVDSLVVSRDLADEGQVWVQVETIEEASNA